MIYLKGELLGIRDNMKIEVCLSKIQGLPKEGYWTLVYQDNAVNFIVKDIIKFPEISEGAVLINDLIVSSEDVSIESINYLRECSSRITKLVEIERSTLLSGKVEIKTKNSYEIADDYIQNFINEYEDSKKKVL